MKTIPLHRPSSLESSRRYLREATDGPLQGDGPFGRRCREWLERHLGAQAVFLTPSCTHALELAALTLRLEPGDEAVLPTFTFVSTANAFALRGCRLRFADVREDTLNIDEGLLERHLSRRTRVVVPVHYGGVACAMEAIDEAASSVGADVVEDAAHGIFGDWRGRPLGTIGALGALSFHGTKNVTCGEGGALVVNREALADRAEILREKGTNRAAFFRGEVDSYTWVDVGSSQILSDLSAAFLLGQLEAGEDMQRKRERIAAAYDESLGPWANRIGARLPTPSPEGRSAWHTYHLLLPGADRRRAFIRHLADHGVTGAFHYLPLHLSPVGRRLGGEPGDCPVAEDVAARLVRIPLYPDLSEEDLARVVDAVTGWTG